MNHKIFPVLFLAVLVLTGCGASMPTTQEVRVPVRVPCKVEAPSKPAFAVDGLPIGAPIDEQMKALRAERHQRKAYERELEAAVHSCQ